MQLKITDIDQLHDLILALRYSWEKEMEEIIEQDNDNIIASVNIPSFLAESRDYRETVEQFAKRKSKVWELRLNMVFTAITLLEVALVEEIGI